MIEPIGCMLACSPAGMAGDLLTPKEFLEYARAERTPGQGCCLAMNALNRVMTRSVLAPTADADET